MKTSVILISSLTLSWVQFVNAGTMGAAPSSTGYYINANVGVVFSNSSSGNTSNSSSVLYSPTSIGTSLFSLPNVNWQNRFKNGYGIDLSIGKYLSQHLHSDIEFLYQNIQRTTYGSYGWLEQNSVTGETYAQQANNPISAVSNRANIYAFMTNANYDLMNTGKFVPFLGAGVGVAWLKAGSNQTNNRINIDDPNTPLIETAPALQNSPSLYGTAFAWQLKAGLNYSISEKIAAVLQYRLFGTTEFKGSQSNIITNPGVAGQTVFHSGQQDIKGLLTNEIELGLRFNV